MHPEQQPLQPMGPPPTPPFSATNEALGSHANLKRRRVSRACDKCRLKKIKCSGEQPCMHCTVYSYACTFDQPSPRRRVHTQDQVDQLEERSARYERLLRAFARRQKLTLTSEDGNLLQKELLSLEQALNLPEWQESVSPDGDSPPYQSSKTQVSTPGKQLESMIDGVGELHMDVHGQTEYRGDSSGTRFTHSVCSRVLDERSLATGDIYGNGDSIQHHLRARSQSRQGAVKQENSDPADEADEHIELEQNDVLADSAEDVDLPPRDIAKVLIKLCFDHALAALQFFHEPSFHKEMQALYKNVEAEEDVEEEPFLPVFFATLAVGCIFSKGVSDELNIEDPKLRAFQYFQASKRRSDPLTRANYFVLQTLLCQSLFLQSTANMSVCWSHLGLALKCAQRMGIQRNLGRAFRPKERHLRKKLFWILRNLDMYLHAVLGLPRGIEEEDYDQAPAEELDDEYLMDDDLVGVQPADIPSTYNAVNQSSKLMTILGHIVRQVYPIGREQGRATISHQAIGSLEQELNTWYDGLPRHIREEAEATRLGLMHWRITTLIHYNYHHIQFLLYRPFLHYIADSGRPQHQSYAIRCKQAAFAILDLTTRVLDNEPQLFGHILTLYATFFAGLILFYCLIQEETEAVAGDREACLKQADIAIRAMVVCSSCSFAAERCLEILQQMKKQVPVHSAKKLKQREHVNGSGSSGTGSGRSRQQKSNSSDSLGNGSGPSSILSSRSSESSKTTVTPRAQNGSIEPRGRGNKNKLSLAGSMPGPDPMFNSSAAKSTTSKEPTRPPMQSRLNPSFSNYSSHPQQQMTQSQHQSNSQDQQVTMEYGDSAFAQLDYPMGQHAMQVMGTPQTFDFDGVSDTYQPYPPSSNQLGQEQWLPHNVVQMSDYAQPWLQYDAQSAPQQDIGLQGQQWNGQEWTQQDYQQDQQADYISHKAIRHETQVLIHTVMSDEDYDELFGDAAIDEHDIVVIDDEPDPVRKLVQTTLDGRRLAEGRPTTPRPRKSPTSAGSDIAAQKYANARFRDRQEPPTHHKLDESTIGTWVFPTNYAQRDYQFNMISKALFTNVLVALPTGLGKTFIAAIVMFNWYRWAPESKIVFLAPTKPLVAQQIEACYHICGIPWRDIAEMTGSVPAAKRTSAYKERRVFFMTPQTFQNDLRNGLVDGRQVSCLVIDEAHHATGSYAYTEVVAQIKAVSQSFRVLALTATPGRTVEGVQEVIDNLLISQIEIRNDESLDIRAYTHTKDIETISLDLDHDMIAVQTSFASLVKHDLDRIKSMGVGCTSDATKISAFGIRDAVNRFCIAARGNGNMNANAVRSIGAFVASMGQSMTLLNEHGMRPFYEEMKELRAGVKGSQMKARVVNSRVFKEMMADIEEALQDPNYTGHPKLDYLNGLILNHFQKAAEAGEMGTRVMVFSSLRASTEVIIASLKRHHPLVKATGFYGQSKGKGETGMSQKEQLATIKKFKEGVFNVLVATSVGEEGLDIGEIDMIICYDTSSSPARMLQRMGRTGRKRSGQVFVLCTKGKEEMAFVKAKDAHRVMQRKIESGKDIRMSAKVPRILPWNINPVCEKRLLELPEDDRPEDRELKTLTKTKKQKKVFAMPENAERGFTTAKALAKKKPAPFRLDDALIELTPSCGLLDAAGEDELERRFGASRALDFNAGAILQENGCFSDVKSLYSLDTTVRVPHSKTLTKLVHMVGQEWRPAKLKAKSEQWKRIAMQSKPLSECMDDSDEGFGNDRSSLLQTRDSNVQTKRQRKQLRMSNTTRKRKHDSDSDEPLMFVAKKTSASVISKSRAAENVEHLFSDVSDDGILTRLTIDESSPEYKKPQRKGVTSSQLDRESDDDLPEVAVMLQGNARGRPTKHATPLKRVAPKLTSSAARRRIKIVQDESDDESDI
ncbi:hypothetical protein BCR37DRAFT_387579 [Protomyces lactucae-debilis]|uniref:DNA helicase n=1 Tax=Protomyces lactucae-debilis TaxID=2754530 RepID=A0A1Y2FH28_PROLT|nr:uncharacterized protein BCR37DRAFT_387579 [Protomyces lactucae-debilis]ORY82115.1 hypothetical protein BCR37DRAFT_387579 [Protomyces lactucae-debilis]